MAHEVAEYKAMKFTSTVEQPPLRQCFSLVGASTLTSVQRAELSFGTQQSMAWPCGIYGHCLMTTRRSSPSFHQTPPPISRARPPANRKQLLTRGSYKGMQTGYTPAFRCGTPNRSTVEGRAITSFNLLTSALVAHQCFRATPRSSKLNLTDGVLSFQALPYGAILLKVKRGIGQHHTNDKEDPSPLKVWGSTAVNLCHDRVPDGLNGDDEVLLKAPQAHQQRTSGNIADFNRYKTEGADLLLCTRVLVSPLFSLMGTATIHLSYTSRKRNKEWLWDPT